mgnify:CR=1 FL=1
MKEEKNIRFQKVKNFFASNPELKDLDVVEKKPEPETEKFEDVTLADGVTMVTILPALEPNATITTKAEDGTDVPMPVGEYELADGRIIVVEVEGVVMEVREPNGDEPPVEEEELSNESTAQVRDVKKVIESIVKESVFASAEEVKSVKQELEAMKKENEFLHKENDAMKVLFAELKENTGIALEEVFKTPAKEPVKKKKNIFEKQEKSLFGVKVKI